MGGVYSKRTPCTFDDSLYIGDDVLSAANEVLMENILMHLELKDLLVLSMTSKKMKEHVRLFALHYVLSYSRMEKLQMFLNCELLTTEEMALKRRVAQCGEPTLATSLYYLMCIKRYANIRRFSVTEAIDFPHYGNSNYIVKENCQLLGRDIVHLKTVCWLHFKQILPQVTPGTYQVSVHFLLGSNFRWPSGRTWGGNHNKCSAELQVIDENGDKNDPPLVEVEIEPEYWSKIKNSSFENNVLRGNATVAKGDNAWRVIKLKPILIPKKTNLAFVWKDIHNPWWKNDMYWDYVQIHQV